MVSATKSAELRIDFPNTGDDFSGLSAAEEWCKANGYSVGSVQNCAPIGLMKGKYLISKWRNMSAKEKEQLDGRIEFRSGPREGDAVVVIKKSNQPEHAETVA